jgi:hypothetical protein
MVSWLFEKKRDAIPPHPARPQALPVDIVPLPKRWGEQRRKTIGKESEILTSSPFKCQLDGSLNENSEKGETELP